MVLSNRYILPILIAFGLSLPQGLTNMFLPSVKVSSVFDGVDIRVAILSFQTILTSLYILIFIKKLRLKSFQVFLAIILLYFSFAGAFFSLAPGGYISYSLLWFILPFAVLIHSHNFNYAYAGDDLIEDIFLVGVIFFPLYLIDIAVSIAYLGSESFSSFMLASNGHSFISLLFSLVSFIKFSLILKK